jgi:hypothetical protein
MENQHRKITGYRDLNQQEIDLMNKIKALGPVIEGVLLEVQQHLMELRDQANGAVFDPEIGRKVAFGGGDEDLTPRMNNATPERFLALAKTDLQTGLMYLTRAVAQPEFF